MAIGKISALELHKGDSITIYVYGLPEDAKDTRDRVKRILNLSVTDDCIEVTDMAGKDLPIVFMDAQ